ncbi:MAG: ATP-binding protein [Firmicutes bacterium]|nr:ATP-binding protein [Bacillota bacterium]
MIRKIYRQMLITQILSAMTVMICMMIDSMMIGRFLGVDSVTAYGLASPVLLVFAAFGSMLSAGIQVMCGKTVGSGDMEGTNACYSASMVMAVGVAILGVALVLILQNPLTSLLGAGKPTEDNVVFFLTRDYLDGFIQGAPAFILAQIMVPFMQISGSRSRLVAAVLMMTVSDIVFDILNVFVFHGGTFGMGLASSLSYYLALVIGLTYFLKKDCMFKLKLKSVKARICADLFRYGIPTVINQISLVLLVFVLNKILLAVGKNLAVAAYSVVSTIGNICYSFSSGVGSVALLLSAVFFVDEDRNALRTLIKTMTLYAIFLDLAVILVMQLFAPPLVSLFLPNDPAAKEMTILGVRLFSLSLVPSAMNTAFKNYCQGVEKTRLTEVISVIQNFVSIASFAFILSRFLGTTGVWLGFVSGESLTLLLIAVYVWVKQKKITFSVDAFSFLEPDFGVSEHNLFERSIHSAEEAIEASRCAAEFCREHGEKPRECMLISLSIEEIVNNIIEYGFTKDKERHSINVRILFKEKQRVIRIRDNCLSFDPVEYLKLHQTEEDPAAHIGIRMIMKMVKDANYVNSLGLNNLTLVL